MSSGGGGAEGGAAGKKKSSSIYCFFYGTRYIQDIVKNLDWHHRTSLRAALRCYGRVFVGPTYLPALRPCKVYSMHVELPVKELEALLQRLKLEKQLTAVPSGDKSRARGDKMVLHSFAATLDAQRPPVGHRNPNPDENTSGILVKVTAAELEQIVKLRSKNLEHFEEKVMTIDTKPRATRVAHIWQPKPPHDWVEVPADKILATAENGDKFVDFGKHVKACASFMYDFRLSEKKTDIRDFDFVPRGYFYCSKGADGKKRYKAGIYATKNEASTGAGAARAFVQAPVPGPAPAPAPVPAPARAPAPVSSPALAQKKPADWLALVAKKERELDQKIQAKESVIKSSLAQFNVKVQNALRDLVEEQKLLGDFDAGNVMNSNNKRNSALVAADRGDETEEDVVSREADAYVGAQKEWLESAQSGARCRFGRVQKCFDALGFLEDDGFGHVQSLLQFRSVDAFWMNRRGLNSNGSGDDQDDDDEEVFDVDIRVTAHEPTGVVSLEIIAERMMYVGRSIQSEVVHLVDCALSKETSVFEHSSVVGHSCGAENRRFIEICDLNGESLDEWMPDPDLLELDATPLEPHVGPTSPRFNSKEQLKRQRQRQAFLRFHPSFTVENKPLVVGPLQSKQARQLVAVVDAASSSVAPHQRLLYMQRALSIRSIALAEPSMWRENRGDFLVWHNAGSAEVEVVFSPTASVIGQVCVCILLSANLRQWKVVNNELLTCSNTCAHTPASISRTNYWTRLLR
eukprot:INCI6237.5.p1 GENE.INCI6237.5~~INCI6237.5.p1  ORF type:complete len:765 (+),score=148.00 INCI6237.5:63-2297(+)